MVACERFRVAVSAGLDGEDPGLPDVAVEAHLARCLGCRRFAAEAAELDRVVRLRPVAADEPTDRTRDILLAIGAQQPPGPARRGWWLVARIGLVLVAVLQLVHGLPDLLVVGHGGDGTHLVRELGAFDVALAVGFAVAGLRPARAAGLLPVVAALVAGLTLAVGVDLVHDRVTPAAEIRHVLELAGVALLWILRRPPDGTPRERPA